MPWLSGWSPEVLPCPSWSLSEALTVLYRRVPEAVRSQLVTEACQAVAAGTIDLSGLWIGRRRGRVVGVVLTQRLASHAAAVWAPEVILPWRRGALAAALVRAALDQLRRAGVKVAQAMVEETNGRRAAADLVRGGLRRVTDLVYLARDTATPLDLVPGAPELAWSTYAPDRVERFRDVLEATYIASLDMPELEGARSLDDLLTTHRAAGTFNPTYWRLGEVPGEPASAVLLIMNAPADRSSWEIAYLGLTPPARGRGLGRAALAHALNLARPHVVRLELAMDVRNEPARRLYTGAGFIPFDRRAVYLAQL